MKRLIVILLILNSSVGLLDSYAQKSTDEKVEAYLNNFYELEYTDISAAKTSLDSALALTNKVKSPMTLGRLKMYQGWYLQDLGEYDSSRACFYQSLTHYTQANSYNDIADVYGNLGNSYMDIGDIKMSLDFQLKSMNLNESIISLSKDAEMKERAIKGRAYAWTNIAGIYTALHEYEKALDYQLKGLEFEKTKGDSLGIAISYLGLATNYQNLNRLDSSVWYGEQSYRIFKQHNYTVGLLNSCIGLFDNYYKRGRDRYDLLFEAYDLAIISQDKYAQVLVLKSLIGSNYPFSTDSLSRMIVTANKLIDEYEFQAVLGDYYRVEANYYAKNGDFKKAFFSQLEFLDYFSRTNSKQHEVDYKSAELKQEFLQKAMQDSLNYAQTIHQQKVKQEKELASQGIIVTISIFGSLILIVILGFMLRAFRMKKRTNQQLNYKNILIENQRDMMAEKNKEITDSINYAVRLQNAILPPLQIMKAEIPLFIYYQPKDVVSGDFYWFEKKGDEIYLAAADCTGHGVPGAMVSVVCSNSLDRSVNEFHLTSTADILNKTRELVINTFSNSTEDVKDGMDIALCKINLKKKELSYSGAYNPLWLARKKEQITSDDIERYDPIESDEAYMLELKGDKQPIGLYADATNFKETIIQLKKGDTVYLFTDGYADQFGGESGKKLKYKPFKELLLSLEGKNVEEQEKCLSDFMNDWKRDYDQLDDICVVGIQIH